MNDSEKFVDFLVLSLHIKDGAVTKKNMKLVKILVFFEFCACMRVCLCGCLYCNVAQGFELQSIRLIRYACTFATLFKQCV